MWQGFNRGVRCLLKKEPQGSVDNQQGSVLGFFLALMGPAPKDGLVNPRMPSRAGLREPGGAEGPGQPDQGILKSLLGPPGW